MTNDLASDQRVKKVCDTLTKNNFNITLVGRQLQHSLNINRPYKTVRFKLIFNKGALFYMEYNLRLFFFFYAEDLIFTIPTT